MLSPWIQAKLADSNWFCEGLSHLADIKCQRATGFQAVYRLCGGMASFFFIMMVLMFGVKSSQDVRSSIQNGHYSLISCLLRCFRLLVLQISCPDWSDRSVLLHSFGEPGWTWVFFLCSRSYLKLAMMWIGMIGGFLFILIQLILIIDFAHGLAQDWVEKYEENDSRACYAGLIVFTFGCYGIALTGVVLMYIFYTTVSIYDV